MEIEEKIKAALSAREEIKVAYLFGSRKRGTATAASDTDIALLLDEKKITPRQGMEIDYSIVFEEETGLKNIDIRILNVSPLFFQYEVLKDSVVIFCRDEVRRIRYEADLMLDYFDFKPYLEYYNRRMHEHIKEGSYGPGLSINK